MGSHALLQGIEPLSPALAGRLFTTELPGKSGPGSEHNREARMTFLSVLEVRLLRPRVRRSVSSEASLLGVQMVAFSL